MSEPGPNTESPGEISVEEIGSLALVRDLLTQFSASAITYCHWKSNYHIRYALAGAEDLDLLVAANDFPRFVDVLMRHGFKVASTPTSRHQPGVFHFLGSDSDTGRLINVHAYTRILTGDHFTKCWALPFEKMLLEQTRSLEDIQVPMPGAELVVFVLRSMIKHTTLFDLRAMQRTTNAMREESAWLRQHQSSGDWRTYLHRWFPEISPDLFERALAALSEPSGFIERAQLGFRFAHRLRKFRRYSRATQIAKTVRLAVPMTANKFLHKQKHMRLSTGGKVVALVGPQATGKSTLLQAARDWLGTELSARIIHVGKPPDTWYSWPATVAIPLLRQLRPGERTMTIELSETKRYPWLYVVRKVLIAAQRRALLRRAFRQSRNGEIVLCDRYPSDEAGAVDGRSFTDEAIAAEGSLPKRTLMRVESAIYRDITPPDLVVELAVSEEVAVQRNITRNKPDKQTNDYVRARHAQKTQPKFERCAVEKLDTSGALEPTVLSLKDIVWRYL